jgi:hypothetical protein
LSHFISRLGEKGLPLYRLLKKHERFSWTVEAQEALDKLKVTLAHAPILTPPQDSEPGGQRRHRGRAHEGGARPASLAAGILNQRGSVRDEAHYPQVQKLLYAVVLARRKLCHYFEAHPVTVVSSFLLGEIIRNPDAEGRIAKWSVELRGETLAYTRRTAVKSQILADFVAE